ncbi:MAG TPA: CoA pyrophosphatase [Acidimicrobiales bacterium]|nr:CoA pyrophosphatase [Acidimicrobiales bacterium]
MTSNDERTARFSGHVYPQVIPEPDEIVTGAPAPWSSLAPGDRRGLSLARVLERLRLAGRHLEDGAALGEPAEMTAVSDADRRAITRRSAVLVALFEEEGETHLVLTRRSLALRSHRGEIALPGGRADAAETPVQTALREAHEEVGIDPSAVRTVGWLSPIVTFASGSAIWPVVGLMEQRPSLIVDPREVDRAFTVSLAELAADGTFLEERWRRGERRPGADAQGFFPIHFYRVPGDLVWGATARILTELLCVVCDVPWPEAQRVWA